jgi:enamine deaminase RidA (YjgF/YER057c/UK114 family)
MKLSVVAFEASAAGEVKEQAADCLLQLDAFLSDASLDYRNIISINFFLSAENQEAYKKQTRAVEDCLSPEMRSGIPVAYLAQAPANGALVSAEIHYLPQLRDSEIQVKRAKGYPYLVVGRKNGEKLVVANGIGQNNGDHNITENAEKVFGIMEKILHAEGMDFGHIFRQWNYIEDITVVESDRQSSQHYQEFNNVRSEYYSRSAFSQGYPAATGIGIRAGGVIVSFLAASSEGIRAIAIENPLQRAAFDYTDRVLVGNAEFRGSSKCTPKFARAKLLENKESDQVFISGTASIREENTIGVDDVAKQTVITLENMQQLICAETLSSIQRSDRRLPSIEFIRVYVKYPEHHQIVKEICEERLPGVPGIYVVSDVCRENLLVEIEALASS